MRKIELLAPVGKLENALAAIENGADAIFVGGKVFNARQYADNFGDDELEEIVRYCKLRGVQVHVTVNILVKEQEMDDLIRYIQYLDALQVDAVIVQDFGVLKVIREYFPNMTVHASTQMTAHSLEDVKFLESCGFTRVVLARELQLKDIEYIKSHTNVEIETFIHGALCYSYSGQCLLSSLIGGRSGNRGRCAQPCRMTYSLYEEDEKLIDNLYLLSPKDICTLSILPSLIACGIDSFKIEGRMKSPEYVASVTKVYRKYIDLALNDPKNYRVDEEDMATLQSIFNRGGFSEGYYHQKSGKDMITEKTPKNIGLHIGEVTRYNPKTKIATFYTNKTLHPGDGLEIWNKKKHTGTGISKVYQKGETFSIPVEGWVDEGSPVYLSKNHELLKILKKTYEKAERKLPIQGKLYGATGEPIRLMLQYEENQVEVIGEILAEAQNRPLTKEDAKKQFSKLGNTPFVFECFDIVWPENGYMTISQMNGLRREAVSQLENLLCMKKEVVPIDYAKPHPPTPVERNDKVVHVMNREQLDVAATYEEVQAIYWDWHYDNEMAKVALESTKKAGKKFYLVLPAIIKDDIWTSYKEAILQWDETAIDGYVLRTYGSYEVLKASSKEKIIDYTLNIMNNENVSHWLIKGATRITPSLELSYKELFLLEGPLEKIIYGHLPVMTTEQCLLGHYKKCMKHKSDKAMYRLEDRKGCTWPLTTDCISCKMQILMDKPLNISGMRELYELPFSSYRIVLTHEKAHEVKEILNHILRGENFTKETHLGIYLKPIE